MSKTGNKNNTSNSTPTQEEYIAQQIAAKRATALDKSRNRTSVRVPMVLNNQSEEEWNKNINALIESSEIALSKAMANKNYKLAKSKQEALERYLEEKDKGYPKLVVGSNCMYNAGDCYGLNIPGNQTFAAKHKELGFKKAAKGSMEPGDLVQDVRIGYPTHAMIYDSKDNEGNLLFNYARGLGDTDIKSDYIKQGKYSLPIKDYDVYKYVGTPADSAQWINEYKQKYGNGMRCGGRRKAQLGLDIREGGIAIPIANNMFYIDGRKHAAGGVAIGPNNKNGVEVEGGEVVEMIDSNHPSVGRQFKAGGQQQTMRVFSSVPFLRGVSPAQLVMEGANPNAVFKAQEEFKDRNRINDDGTTYEVGGEKTIKYEDLPNVFKGKQVNGRILQGGVPPILSQGAGLTRGNFIQRMGMWNDDLGEFSKYIAKRIHKFIPKKLDLPYRYVVDYFSNKGPNNAIDNNAENLTKAVSLFNAHEYKAGGIYIKPNKRGTFTAAATKHGMSVQGFASKVLANKEDYSPAMVKKANFARNASRWKKEYGGDKNVLPELIVTPRSGYNKIYDASGINKRKKIAQDVLQILPFSGFVNDVLGFTNPINAGGAVKSVTSYGAAKARLPFLSIPGIAFNGALGLPDLIQDVQTLYKDIKTPKEEFNKNKKEFGGSMIYTINGNVRTGLMSARPKAQYGTITRHGKIWKWDEENGAYVPVKDSKEKEPINVNKQTKSSVLSNKKSNYTVNGTFDNARPQFYAEKRLPIAGSQSIAEKAGLARSGWSYGENPTFDYVPNINISIPTNYAKAVGDNSKKSTSSTPRGGETKASASKAVTKSTPTIQDTVNKITMDAWKASKTPKIDLSKVEMPSYNVSDLGSKETKAAKAKLNTSSTGGGTQSKDGRWVGQYKTTNVGDWIGLGSNLAGTIASYFMTKNAINKMPEPVKPIMAQAAKLKTRYNVEPQLSEIREAEQMNRAAVRRNTQSSNTSLAQEQRLMNEARGARNTLYGQKENIETQLINQDRLNRQSVMKDNVRAYNEYLNRLTAAKMAQNEMRVSNVNNLISGLTGSVNNILGNIESRRATNNTLRAIAAANPNVDARLIGGFDYYIDPITKKKYNKNQQYVGTING